MPRRRENCRPARRSPRQAERMLDDPRAKARSSEFLLAWLRVDQSPELAKDAKRFPGFDAGRWPPTCARRWNCSLDDVVWSDASDFRQLLLSDELFLNGRLAKFYGAQTLPADAGFTKVKLEPGPAGRRADAPVHAVGPGVPRRKFADPPRRVRHPRVARHHAPPAARGVHAAAGRAAPGADDARAGRAADQPARASVAMASSTRWASRWRTSTPSAGTGRRRTASRSTSAGTTTRGPAPIAKFAGARQLAAFLAGSEEVQAAFTQQMFQHMVKQPVRAYGLNEPAELQKSFAENGYNVRKLVVEIAVTAARAAASPQGVPSPEARNPA